MVRDSAPGGKRKFLLRRYSGSESVYPRNGILFPLHFGHLLLTRTREIGKADENKKNND